MKMVKNICQNITIIQKIMLHYISDRQAVPFPQILFPLTALQSPRRCGIIEVIPSADVPIYPHAINYTKTMRVQGGHRPAEG
ncbi:MAG: hypothetical protein K6F80_05220, partial [Oscillospiraceae bacterium]|nr:hypothetical protein [Oscillospiraceae bacterium]